MICTNHRPALSSLRGPGFIVTVGARPLPTAKGMARRPVGLIRAAGIGDVIAHPGATGDAFLRWNLIRRVVQPGMPFRRYPRSFRLAGINDPAPLPAQG